MCPLPPQFLIVAVGRLHRDKAVMIGAGWLSELLAVRPKEFIVVGGCGSVEPSVEPSNDLRKLVGAACRQSEGCDGGMKQQNVAVNGKRKGIDKHKTADEREWDQQWNDFCNGYRDRPDQHPNENHPYNQDPVAYIN